MDENKLYGKRISFNGDSICAGDGFRGGYGKIIAERCGMIYQNVGVGGGTITVGVHSKAGVLRHSICGSIDKMDPDADYAIVEGGVTDAFLSLRRRSRAWSREHHSTLSSPLPTATARSILKGSSTFRRLPSR